MSISVYNNHSTYGIEPLSYWKIQEGDFTPMCLKTCLIDCTECQLVLRYSNFIIWTWLLVICQSHRDCSYQLRTNNNLFSK